jgi:hypothetical protein
MQWVKDPRANVAKLLDSGLIKDNIVLMGLAKMVIEHPLQEGSRAAYEKMVRYSIDEGLGDVVAILSLEIEGKPSPSLPPVRDMGEPFKYLTPMQRELLILKARLCSEVDPLSVEAIKKYDKSHPLFADLEQLECAAIKAWMEGLLSDGEVSAAMILAISRFDVPGRVEVLDINTDEGKKALMDSCRSSESHFMSNYNRIPFSEDRTSMQRDFYELVLSQAEGLSPIETVLLRINFRDDYGPDLFAKEAFSIEEFGGESSYILLMPKYLDKVNQAAYGSSTRLHQGSFGYTKRITEFMNPESRPISCPFVGAHYPNVHGVSLKTAYHMYFHDTLHLMIDSQIPKSIIREMCNIALFLNNLSLEEGIDQFIKTKLKNLAIEIADDPLIILAPDRKIDTKDFWTREFLHRQLEVLFLSNGLDPSYYKDHLASLKDS